MFFWSGTDAKANFYVFPRVFFLATLQIWKCAIKVMTKIHKSKFVKHDSNSPKRALDEKEEGQCFAPVRFYNGKTDSRTFMHNEAQPKATEFRFQAED